MDILIRSAKLLDGQVSDIGIDKGKIVDVCKKDISHVKIEIDAKERLVVPAFVEPHIHLDKANILDGVRPNKTGTLKEAIEIIWEKKRNYTADDIVSRGSKVLERAIKNGTLSMRTHVDVDTIGELKPLEGVLALREKYKEYVDIQIVAFPQEGIYKNKGCDKLMRQAMEKGADVVGGMPANENTDKDSLRHIKMVFDLAQEFDADVDMHVDETDDPSCKTLEMLVDETITRGWQGRVTAGHTCALAAYDDVYANYVMDKVLEAKVHMITNPATNLMLQGRNDKQPIRRGITRVKELLNRGINMSFGQDCVRDTFYPFGSADMLKVALITAHAAQMSLPAERNKLMDMVTYDAASILGLKEYGLISGNQADIVIIDAKTVDEAIRLAPLRSYVIRKGHILYESALKEKIFLNSLV